MSGKTVTVNREIFDFQKIINELYSLDRQWNDRTIANAIGVSPMAICHLRTHPGVDPKHSTGEALKKLHEKAKRKARRT